VFQCAGCGNRRTEDALACFPYRTVLLGAPIGLVIDLCQSATDEDLEGIPRVWRSSGRQLARLRLEEAPRRHACPLVRYYHRLEAIVHCPRPFLHTRSASTDHPLVFHPWHAPPHALHSCIYSFYAPLCRYSSPISGLYYNKPFRGHRKCEGCLLQRVQACCGRHTSCAPCSRAGLFPPWHGVTQRAQATRMLGRQSSPVRTQCSSSGAARCKTSRARSRPAWQERLCKRPWRRRLGTGYASAGAYEVDWSKKGIWFAGGQELDQVHPVADFHLFVWTPVTSVHRPAAAVLPSQTPLVRATRAASCCVVMPPARAGGGAALWERRARARGGRVPGLDARVRRPGVLRLGRPAEQAWCHSPALVESCCTHVVLPLHGGTSAVQTAADRQALSAGTSTGARRRHSPWTAGR